jgi:hypothetical protein
MAGVHPSKLYSDHEKIWDAGSLGDYFSGWAIFLISIFLNNATSSA